MFIGKLNVTQRFFSFWKAFENALHSGTEVTLINFEMLRYLDHLDLIDYIFGRKKLPCAVKDVAFALNFNYSDLKIV